MNEYREQLDEARQHGLRARHEYRMEHAVESALKGEWIDTPLTRMLLHAQAVTRREVAEEIAQAIEAMKYAKSFRHEPHYQMCAAKAREIGARNG